ncbi:hypothetical protein FMUND_6734 [Fusarium mundagurra]|uniref:Transmembrane protein n=1 Tax=Fusarium mundagurra TaxID=1567541 RepID=A0A8H6DGH3_9HYPO|nr:hypothetical protein FMUND_6734 [Fusarium mundagurra]
MAPRTPHRKRRNNARTPSQGSPRTPSSESTTAGSSLPQTPWSSDFGEQDATSRPSTRSSEPASFDIPSYSNTTWPSPGSSNPSMAEIETFETNVQDFSCSPLKDADASSSRIAAELPAEPEKPDDKSDDHGYLLETILLDHLKFLRSCIWFPDSHCIFARWTWERAYPLNPVEQLAAFAERHRDNDILAFCILQTSYYVTYYYFACAQYLFPAKYEYNIWNDQVVRFMAGLVVIIAILAFVIGKIFDWVMRDSNDAKKRTEFQDIIYDVAVPRLVTGRGQAKDALSIVVASSPHRQNATT